MSEFIVPVGSMQVCNIYTKYDNTSESQSQRMVEQECNNIGDQVKQLQLKEILNKIIDNLARIQEKEVREKI